MVTVSCTYKTWFMRLLLHFKHFYMNKNKTKMIVYNLTEEPCHPHEHESSDPSPGQGLLCGSVNLGKTLSYSNLHL